MIEEARKYAISEIEKFGTPTLINFNISERKAVELAEKLNANKEVVLIGNSLMDLKLGQAKSEDRIKEHVKMSSDAAKDFLEKSNLNQETKDKIINCVEAHHGTIPFNCIEAEICANADCYRFIHPKGFFAYLTFLGKTKDNFDDCLNQAEKKMDEKHNILSLDICKEELEEYYKTLKKFITESKQFPKL